MRKEKLQKKAGFELFRFWPGLTALILCISLSVSFSVAQNSNSFSKVSGIVTDGQKKEALIPNAIILCPKESEKI